MERAMLESPTVGTSRRGRRGFTLVELALVVAIVGILAVIALVGYRRYMLHSRVTEAKGIIGAIKIAQEDYRSERGIYANLGKNLCPAQAGTGNKKVGWDPSCNAGNLTWQALPVHVTGGVLFKYGTNANANATEAYRDDFGAASWVAGTNNISAPWYSVYAECDLNGDGGKKTMLFSTSHDNQIFTRDEGE